MQMHALKEICSSQNKARNSFNLKFQAGESRHFLFKTFKSLESEIGQRNKS